MSDNGQPVAPDAQLAADFVASITERIGVAVADLMANESWCKQLAGYVAERMDGLLQSRLKDIVLMIELEREKVRQEGPMLALLRHLRAKGIVFHIRRDGTLGGKPRELLAAHPDLCELVKMYREPLTNLVRGGW